MCFHLYITNTMKENWSFVVKYSALPLTAFSVVAKLISILTVKLPQNSISSCGTGKATAS